MISNKSMTADIMDFEGDIQVSRIPPIKDQVSDRLLFGNSDKMKLIGKTISQIADTDVPVLIVGESGTGKELVANSIHRISLRKNRVMVKVNCVAIPGELLESELFGYEKGAFTGAYNKKPGRFEFADKGTLFLDEIGDMPLALQAKMLRTLQEGRFFRLGGNQELEIDARVIAATHKDLEEAIKHGTFREDLFYRLNVIKIRVPPLRERKEEIYPLVDYFLGKYSQSYNKNVKKLSENNSRLLMDYDWPGNVRELENVIKKYVVLESDDILAKKLNINENKEEEKTENVEHLKDFDEGFSLKEIGKRAAAEAEKVAINKVLDQTHWNRTRAAEIMKISYKTLLNKMKENGL